MGEVVSATNKPFGIRGELTPPGAFRDIIDDIIFDGGIVISVHDKLLEVGYDKEEDKECAQKIAQSLIVSWSFRNGTKVGAMLNTSWKPDSNGNKVIGLELVENIKVHDRVITTVKVKTMAYIVKKHSDSYSFMNDTDLVKKVEKDQVLSLVLRYFYDEVLGAERPKVGISRIIEELTKKLGGRENLGRLVGQGKKYINDIMESVQEHRHSLTWLISQGVKVKLSDQECIDRTKKLIQAYAEHV